MRPQSVTVSSVAASAPIVMDRLQNPFNVGFGVVISGGGSATYSVQHTFDNILGGATATWFDNSTVAGETTNMDGNYAFPVTAIRLNVTVYGSGTVTLTALQGSSE
jgi:hypothetical protein